MPDPSSPHGTDYIAIDLRPLSDGEGTNAYAVSDAGVTVGESGSRPARWDRDGRPSPLPVLDGYSGGRASCVNSSGVIAGVLYRGENLHPVRWDSTGRVHDLELPADTVSGTASRVNDRGSIMGNAMGPGYHWRAVRWNPQGELVDLETLTGSGETQAHDLNALDEVVGSATNGASTRAAVRWDHSGKVSTLPPPHRATACGINDSGEVAGDGVVWDREGRATTMSDEPGFTAGHLVKINNHGVAIGWGVTPGQRATCARWDRAGRLTVLAPLPSDIASNCFDISDTGTVVGESANQGSVRPVWWDAEATPSLLPSPPGLSAILAQHINGPGTVIIGYGYDAISSTYRGIAWHRS